MAYKRNEAWSKKPEPPKATSSRPEIQTIDVVYKCGHEGKRREIVYPHVGVSHTLEWIKGNVKCRGCYGESSGIDRKAEND